MAFWKNRDSASFTDPDASGQPGITEVMDLIDDAGVAIYSITQDVDGIVTAEPADATETITAAGALSPSARYSSLEVVGGGVVTLDIPPLSMIGELKTISMTVDDGDVSLDESNIVNGSLTGHITFDDVGDTLTLVAVANTLGSPNWFVIGQYSTNIVRDYPNGTKFYRATLTQASTAAPVATVGQNSLGQTVTPARTSAGLYTLTAGGAVFTADKTQIFIGAMHVPLFAFATRTSTTVITISSADDAAGTPADDVLTETAITIVVFP